MERIQGGTNAMPNCVMAPGEPQISFSSRQQRIQENWRKASSFRGVREPGTRQLIIVEKDFSPVYIGKRKRSGENSFNEDYKQRQKRIRRVHTHTLRGEGLKSCWLQSKRIKLREMSRSPDKRKQAFILSSFCHARLQCQHHFG